MASTKSMLQQQQLQQRQQQRQRLQRQQQKTQQQSRHSKKRMNLHLQLHGVGAAVIVVLIGLLLTVFCVSGQIDGYTAGLDYPAYESVPKNLAFKCQGRIPGYYADIETRCQVWHWCLHSGHQYSFLCPNGTVFNQAVRVCDWWSNVDCPASEQLYQNNDELYKVSERTRDNNI